ncbi:hypothetical protein PENTCL1PPCAC_5572, partial [Pristionchus entomophagus]
SAFLRGVRSEAQIMQRKRGHSSCVHLMCDIIANNQPEHALGFICESIVLTEHHFGQDHYEAVREMCLEAMSKYGPGTPFESDERMLPVYRIMGKYAKSIGPTQIYDLLHEKNLFEMSAQFYADWADAYLTAGNAARAAQIITLASSKIGMGNPLLEAVQESVDRVIAGEGEGGETSSTPHSSCAPADSVLHLGWKLPDQSPPLIDSLPDMSRPPPPLPSKGAQRRVFGPIQAPSRGPAPFAAAPAARATVGQAAVGNDFPSLSSKDELPSDWLTSGPPRNHGSGGSNKENERQPMASAFVLPNISVPSYFSPDMISPSLAQMKPGSQNNFHLPPSSCVFSFTDPKATSGPEPEQQTPPTQGHAPSKPRPW